jgi:Tfp pilus assembly protein PilO
MNIRRLPRGGTVAAIIVGDLLLLALGWFMLVGPQRATASSIARSAQATEVQVEQATAEAAQASTPQIQQKQPEIRTAYLYKLSKAMPTTTDMPNLLLELSQVVRETGVTLSSISPTAPDPTGVTAITIAVSGDFYSVTDLLYRLRSLVGVHGGGLDVSGRLFTIKSVNLTPVGTGRELNSSIELKAYTFGAAATAASPSASPAASDTTSTTTGETTTSDSTSADVGIAP